MQGLPRGILVAIEGIDGAGKTTQAAALAVGLAAQGLEVVTSKEPTNGPWGQRIRASAGTGRMGVSEELKAFLEDRRAHVNELIAPALERGAIVIVDRYYFSNAAYQGARGLDADEILRVNEAFAPRPDLVAVLGIPVVVGLERIRLRGDVANQFEQREALEASGRIFASFKGDHVLHLDGRMTAEAVTQCILLRLWEGPLFRSLCQKPYKPNCEPEYCSFRETCRFPKLGGLVPLRAPEWAGTLRSGRADPSDLVEELVRGARGRK